MQSRVHPAKINKLNFIINNCTQNKIVLTAIKINFYLRKNAHRKLNKKLFIYNP